MEDCESGTGEGVGFISLAFYIDSSAFYADIAPLLIEETYIRRVAHIPMNDWLGSPVHRAAYSRSPRI